MDEHKDETTQAAGDARRAERWPGLDPAAAAGGCGARGCAGEGLVRVGRVAFCRDHWPAVRRWLAGEAVADAPFSSASPDLSDLYDRREALEYVNGRLTAAGARTLSEGTFIKRLYEDLYPATFALEPLRLGERTGEQITRGGYARLMAFTRRMLDAFVALRLEEGAASGPVRPTAAERAAFLAAPEAAAWLNEWWAARGIDYRVSRLMMAYHRKTGRVPAVRVGNMDVYRVDDLEALAREVGVAGGWETRSKQAGWRR